MVNVYEHSQEDRIISEFLKAIGPWRDTVVIGGGFALFIYKLYLSDPILENFPVGTRDIDSLIPRKLPTITEKNLSGHLKDSGFTRIHKDLDIPASEAYVKDIEGTEIEVEFLTDSLSRQGKFKNIDIGGVIAQPLSYLSMSLHSIQQFRTYSGEVGRVVSPGAWIFHKGLTFVRRKSGLKSLKDLYGIWYVATQLGDFSNGALEEFKFLGRRHPRWQETFEKNLVKWVMDAPPLEWSKLEAQDPAGNLKKIGFEKLISSLKKRVSPK